MAWDSNTQKGSMVEALNGAGVPFNKSVYLPFATAVVGTLTDSATLTDPSTTITMTPSLNVGITAAPLVSLQITKNINVAFGTDQTFTFVLTDSHANPTPASVTVTAGQTQGTTTVGNLIPDKYTVSEDLPALWTNDGPKMIDLSPVSIQLTFPPST